MWEAMRGTRNVFDARPSGPSSGPLEVPPGPHKAPRAADQPRKITPAAHRPRYRPVSDMYLDDFSRFYS